jgi:protein phosphatase
VGSVRRAAAAAIVLVVLAALAAGAYVAMQSVYFIGTNNRGLVTVFRGVPFRLPGNVPLYSSTYVSGVSASTLGAERRRTLLDHALRSRGNAASLIRSLELGQLE